MKKLHPHAKVLFYLSGVIAWVFILGIILIPISIPLALESEIGIGVIFFLFFIGLIVAVITPLPFAHLIYESYRYELQKDRVYIERGVIWKKYVSIPYERVQNVDILRGPLARMLELSDLQIQTAGATHLLVEGRIPGISVEEANTLKEQILSKVSGKKQGL